MLSKNQLGFLYMLLSVCAFSVMDLIVKWSDNYPLGQVIFFRGFFGLVLYYFVIPKERLKDFYVTKRPMLHFSRCFFGLMALLSIFTALRNLPLATVVSISFAAPIFTTLFSIFFLSEKVGYFRWLAVFVGFEIITKVPPTLHTPLMSGSNAISGIAIIGAILATIVDGQIGMWLGFIAVVFAMINVIGGFLVTDRMLKMFKRK